ncbi:MAG: hypothetical protein QM503_05805 [Bacteroidota bacterium]
MSKKNINKKEEEVEKLIHRKKEESEALRKMLQKLNSKNVKTKK